MGWVVQGEKMQVFEKIIEGYRLTKGTKKTFRATRAKEIDNKQTT